MPQLRRLAASRAAGWSWREALGELGLEVPRDLTDQARAVRLEVNEFWDRLLPLTGLTLDSINSVAKITLTTFLKRILA